MCVGEAALVGLALIGVVLGAGSIEDDGDRVGIRGGVLVCSDFLEATIGVFFWRIGSGGYAQGTAVGGVFGGKGW